MFVRPFVPIDWHIDSKKRNGLDFIKLFAGTDSVDNIWNRFAVFL